MEKELSQLKDEKLGQVTILQVTFHRLQVQVTMLLTYKHIGQCPLAY